MSLVGLAGGLPFMHAEKQNKNISTNNKSIDEHDEPIMCLVRPDEVIFSWPTFKHFLFLVFFFRQRFFRFYELTRIFLA